LLIRHLKYSVILSNTLLQTAFSAILPTGYPTPIENVLTELGSPTQETHL